jgi:hypothetical protein
VQLLDRGLAGEDGQVGDQLPVNRGPIGGCRALPGVDHGEREGGIALLLSDRQKHVNAPVPVDALSDRPCCTSRIGDRFVRRSPVANLTGRPQGSPNGYA